MNKKNDPKVKEDELTKKELQNLAGGQAYINVSIVGKRIYGQ